MARLRKTTAPVKRGTSEKAIGLIEDFRDDPNEIIGTLLHCENEKTLDAALENEDHTALLNIVVCLTETIGLTDDEIRLMAERPQRFMHRHGQEPEQRAVPAEHRHYQQPQMAPAPPPPPQMHYQQPVAYQPHPAAAYYNQMPQPAQPGVIQPLNRPRLHSHPHDRVGYTEFMVSPQLPSQPAPRMVDHSLAPNQMSAPEQAQQPEYVSAPRVVESTQAPPDDGFV